VEAAIQIKKALHLCAGLLFFFISLLGLRVNMPVRFTVFMPEPLMPAWIDSAVSCEAFLPIALDGILRIVPRIERALRGAGKLP